MKVLNTLADLFKEHETKPGMLSIQEKPSTAVIVNKKLKKSDLVLIPYSWEVQFVAKDTLKAKTYARDKLQLGFEVTVQNDPKVVALAFLNAPMPPQESWQRAR